MAQNKVRAGAAYVEATLEDSKLKRGLRSLRGTFATAGRALGRTLATGIAAGFATVGLGVTLGLGKIKQAIEDTADVAKVAKGFGLATDKASGLFSVLKSAGAENVRENIESLVTMSSRIGDAVAGKGAQAQELFDGLSVSAKELAALPLDEQFYRLHEAIMQLPDPIDRVNRLMLAFGEDGGKTLIGTLSKSTDELRAQAKAMSVTAEEAESASRAQKALNEASAAWGKLWTEIAVSLAPHMETAADSLKSVFETLESNFSSLVEGMSSRWQSFVNAIAASTAVWESWWHSAKASFGNLRLMIDDFQQAHPGIFDTDPLGLDKDGEHRAKRRAELERQVRESEAKANQLLEQGGISISQKPKGGSPDGIDLSDDQLMPGPSTGQMGPPPAAAVPVLSDMLSAGTFSGRGAGFLGAADNPMTRELQEANKHLRNIERNTDDDGPTFR